MQPDRTQVPLDDIGSAHDLALQRLERAKQELEAAELGYSNQNYIIANSRAYYAIYRAMTACLALELKAFKTHGQTIGAFNKDFVHPGYFPKDIASRISHAQDVRHASDYDDFYLISIAATDEQMETARELIQLVEAFLANLPEEFKDSQNRIT